MEKLTCYVIYASEKIETLSHFLQCASDSHVVPISAVTKEQVSLLGNSSALFNLKEQKNYLSALPMTKKSPTRYLIFNAGKRLLKMNSYKTMILL